MDLFPDTFCSLFSFDVIMQVDKKLHLGQSASGKLYLKEEGEKSDNQ